MTKDKDNTPKINPEIKEKAEELFDLIEEQSIRDGRTTATAENMAEELREILRSHRGMEELRYAYRIAAPQSQLAEHKLDTSIWYMEDDTLKTLQDLANKTRKIAHIPFSEDEDREINTYYLKKITEEAKEQADEINRLINSEWKHRADKYKSELQEMKEA